MYQDANYIDGTTRLYGIVGDPITQVRSPEMVTGEFVSRGINAILLPIHVPVDDFKKVSRNLKKIANLDGLIFTIPFKAEAMRLADRIGPQAEIVGALNVIARRPDGTWAGEIFDGIGCVTALKSEGHSLTGKRVHLIGAGGAGSAIGVAVAHEHPASLTVFDMDPERAAALAARINRVDPAIAVAVGPWIPGSTDFVLNASPVGMLDDARNPLGTDLIPPATVVFDAIVKPEETPLIRAARTCGCQTVPGRLMMRGQIGRIVDFFLEQKR